jgi:pyridoxine kinase
MPAILSIQSHVVYGHVGNSAAVFALQRLGREVWPLHTVEFSNHTGYGSWRGRVFSPSDIDECVAGLAERSVLTDCAGVLSGYMGSPGIGEAILRALEAVRTANPEAVYCCDPVLGDVGRGLYVRSDVAEFIRESATSSATLLTPNHFELDYLVGAQTRKVPALRRAIAALHRKGPKVVLVTSVQLEDTPKDAIDLIASDGEKLWRLRTPKAPIKINGAGDVVAALFLNHWLNSRDAADALAKAASSVFGLVRATAEAESEELALIAAQNELVAPSQVFFPDRI